MLSDHTEAHIPALDPGICTAVSHPQHKTKYSSIEFSNEMQIDHVRVPVIARSVGQWQPKHFC